MKPEKESQRLLSVTRSKAKMFEYRIPEEYHIDIKQDPAKLFTLTIGILGDVAAGINRDILQLDALAEMQSNLIFSARFFDAYLQSRLNEGIDPYLILLGSASYYLCDLPGSSKVLAKRIGKDCPDLEGEGLEDLLLWLLQGDLSKHIERADGPFGEYIASIYRWFIQFFKDGAGADKLLDFSDRLRKAVYETGTPRQLLFGDVIAAIIKKKYRNSGWSALPRYSGLSIDQWSHVLKKDNFMKELWPAQHLIGQKGILQGKSAVVQMPTGAGKTKAIELIVRSAFLAGRTSLVIIVAPLRALCHEIKNSLFSAFQNEDIEVDELSDVLQTDFEIAELLGNKQVLVVTPEKLIYVLRHAPEIMASVGIVIFDEGHQFDNGTRGITYELLITSLRSMLPKGAQKVLISAVISNAEDVGEWLNGDNSAIVTDSNLIPTLRTVGFASWLDQLGRIEYVSNEDPETKEFYVPRVMESIKLKKKPKEKKNRIFPKKTDDQAIALYLGLRLISNGSVAIFCGRKDSVSSICSKVVDLIEREIPLPLPNEFSDITEIQRLYYLYSLNLGTEAPAVKTTQFGIFTHHGNTPNGIRLAVEYAMRKDLIHFVICTSTLAQGVNLPIRYLIVTSVRQGQERIKVRDFQNLIGRTARAGMHTEGSILFADPNIYDKRNDWNEKWRWERVKELLQPGKTEPCISNLLSLFDPIKSDDGKDAIDMNTMEFVKAFISEPAEVEKLVEEKVQEYGDRRFSKDSLQRQISWKISLITSVESFLLSNWGANGGELTEQDAVQLAKETLAYFLADDTKRELICDLFKLLAENISQSINDSIRKRVYGRTLYGMRDAQKIDSWVQANIGRLLSAYTDDEILDVVWPVLSKHVNNSVFNKCNKPAVLQEIAREWIQGKPFYELLNTLRKENAELIRGTNLREFNIDHVVDICEGGFAYDGTLLVAALIEFVELVEQEETSELINRLQLFQKKLKYGLPDEITIIIYELGFVDREIAKEISKEMTCKPNRIEVLNQLKANSDKFKSIILKFPIYYHEVLRRYVDN